MKTLINGVEITPKMAGILEKWYGTAISYDDTLPYGYVRELNEVQDFLCTMIEEIESIPRLKKAIATISCIKNDLKCFIPERT